MTIPARRKLEAEIDRLRDEVRALKGQKASVEHKAGEIKNERDDLLREKQEWQARLLETATTSATATNEQKGEYQRSETGTQTDLVQVAEEDQSAATAMVAELQNWKQWFGELNQAYEKTKETLGRCDQARQAAAGERDAALAHAANLQNEATEVVRVLTQENDALKESISQAQVQANDQGSRNSAAAAAAAAAYKTAFENAEAKTKALEQELKHVKQKFEVYKTSEVTAIKRELAHFKNEHSRYLTMYDNAHKEVQQLEQKVGGLEGIEAKYEEARSKAKKYEKAVLGEEHYRTRHDEMVKKLGDVEAGKRWMEAQAKEQIHKLKDELRQVRARSVGGGGGDGVQEAEDRMQTTPPTPSPLPSPVPSWLRDARSPSPASTPGRMGSPSPGGAGGGRASADRDRAGMLKTIRGLATDKATLSKEVKGLKAANEDMEREIGRLRTANAGLVGKVDELETEVDVWKQTNDVDVERQKKAAAENEQRLCWKQAEVHAAESRAEVVASFHDALRAQQSQQGQEQLDESTSPRKKNKRVASEKLGGTVKKGLWQEEEEEEEEEEEVSEEE
ncbi:hypothetical protein PV08_05892 [Exophiala spinifera]|uniref:Uncharacterized protein n=1 Tax=Exophiala spinifera TaxID=91928 RepID=A0A0D1ZSP1_9EURO|nr:uncharacterized protein PV08_05892 [Exophiala spinifera]KIW15842.1 hypothetical protein PV08_05892 [Exophiala spinifera]